MTGLLIAYQSLVEAIERQAWLVPTLARVIFAAVLFYYFWQSGVSKLDWGNGYYFAMATDPKKKRPKPKIWSAGPNGVDEQGEGDDILKF